MVPWLEVLIHTPSPVLDCVEVWSAEAGGEPVFHYQSVGRVHALALSPDSPTLASATGVDVRLDQPDQRGYWRTLVQAQLPKPVSSTTGTGLGI